MGYLDVNPADLLQVADTYGDLATRISQLPTQAAEETTPRVATASRMQR